MHFSNGWVSTGYVSRRRPRFNMSTGRWVVICFVLSTPLVSSAQTLGGLGPAPTAPRSHGFLTAYRTVVDIAHLSGTDADQRFNWDADVSIDIDVVDASFFRSSLFVDVETIVGSEIRDVDPNQINYTADVSTFIRLPRGELMTTFHHVSRHLSDRATDKSISWNMVGLGYGDRFTLGQFVFDAHGRALWTIERAGVDYEAQFDGRVTLTRPLSPRYALTASVSGVAVKMDPLGLGRDNRTGGQVAGGLTITTGVTAVDLFVALEQRIDALSGSLDLPSWTQVGIRLRTPIPRAPKVDSRP